MFKNLHPRKTKNLIGHEKQKEIFIEAFKINHLHHSWLLEGPAGLGKATFAYCASRALLTLTKKNGNEILLFNKEENNKILNFKFDNNNAMHNKISENTHIDLKVIERDNADLNPYSNEVIPVSKIREIQDFFSKTSGDGGKRIAIIDCIDNINKFGANALLKILEEPPNNSIIFVIANNKSNVLDTIRSRCRSLQFSNLSKADTNTIINNNIAKEITIESLDQLNLLSNGIPGKGILLFQNKGLEIYNCIIDIFENINKISHSKVEDLNSLINSKSNNLELNVLKELSTIFFNRVYRRYLNMIEINFSKKEEEVQKTLINNYTIADISFLWENSYSEINTVLELNLEKKQVVINFINNIKKLNPNKSETEKIIHEYR